METEDKRHMPSDKDTSLHHYLPDDILMKLKAKKEQSQYLQQVWQNQIGDELATHTQAVSYQDGILKVQVESAAWASRLRQQGMQIVRQLRQRPAFRMIKKIQLRVAPDNNPAVKVSNRSNRAYLSEQSRELIGTVAQEINDPGLKAAMLNLSKTSDPTHKNKN
ncbi:MAG: hypothetical protein BMS9Abin33_0605 [Gammaproteobacteria bacterium]|nr:MAG: hypothetical protein BMS9Abin33_0605 [Gammaproteobacteria bacterium]